MYEKTSWNVGRQCGECSTECHVMKENRIPMYKAVMECWRQVETVLEQNMEFCEEQWRM